jgi:hypothetical protein
MPGQDAAGRAYDAASLLMMEERAVDRAPGVNSRAWYPKAMCLLPSGIAFPTTGRITGGSRIISTTSAPHAGGHYSNHHRMSVRGTVRSVFTPCHQPALHCNEEAVCSLLERHDRLAAQQPGRRILCQGAARGRGDTYEIRSPDGAPLQASPAVAASKTLHNRR